MRYLHPGAAHPHPRRSAADLAAWMGVAPARVGDWLDQGLPTTAAGIDAFEAVGWLARHPGAAPALDRRWRRFLRWFAPFVIGTDRTAVRRMQRRHRLCLPPDVDPQGMRWWLPRTAEADEHWQVPVELLPTHALIRDAGAEALAVATVRCAPRRQPLPDVVPLVESVIDGFSYGYRHHRPDDEYHGRTAGSCLDLAFAVGDALTAQGRAWRLCVGVIAHTALANPHFWLEVEIAGGGYAPVDPSLPAIAKTYAHLLDGLPEWRAWVRAYTGGCDSRRITLQRGDAPLRGIPGGATIGSLIGEAMTADGSANAWRCLDWVCGECRYEFATGG